MTQHARDMSPREYIEAKRAAIRAEHDARRRRSDDADIQRIRARHPGLSAAADAADYESYRGRLKELVAAELAMTAADEAKRQAAKQPSVFIREQAADALVRAVATHDDLLREVTTRHAALPAI